MGTSCAMISVLPTARSSVSPSVSLLPLPLSPLHHPSSHPPSLLLYLSCPSVLYHHRHHYPSQPSPHRTHSPFLLLLLCILSLSPNSNRSFSSNRRRPRPAPRQLPLRLLVPLQGSHG